MRIFVLFFCFVFLPCTILAQRFSISGFVKDSLSGESLIGANIIRLKSSAGIAANSHGFYSLSFPSDTITLAVSYTGYRSQILSFRLVRDTVINFRLNGSILNEVVVNSNQANDLLESSRMSTISIPIEQIKSMPALLGEVDLLKVFQLLPGVQSGNEGTTGLYVRGGGPDQNLMLLDGVPVYNVSHLFGFFSVFNADAINHVELVKGGFPARYGGRLSSVIEINMKEGNMKEFHGEGSVGLLAAKLSVEGPIKKDKTSFIFSARRTYADVIGRPFIKKKFSYFFYDVNFKLNHIINSRNRIYLSNYFGKDKGYTHDETSYSNDNTVSNEQENLDLNWGNEITAIRWNHIFNPRLFSNMTAIYSRYHFRVSQDFQESTSINDQVTDLFYGYEYHSNIRDWAGKIDFDYLPDPNHSVKFGAGAIAHAFSPGVYAYKSSQDADTLTGAKTVRANELSAYIEDDWQLSGVLKVNIGVHASAFNVENNWYSSVQPRISARWLAGNNFSVKGSFSRMTQYIHLLTNAGMGLPTDLWVPSTSRIAPQQAQQYTVGLAKTYQSKWEFSVEAYYKKMSNLIEYKDGATYLNIEGDWQDKVESGGHGKSYGIEFFAQRKVGMINGWIGYSLSKTTRQFEFLNFGRTFPYKYDRRHDIHVALIYDGRKNMQVSAIWVFGTGNAITLPLALYKQAGNYNTVDQSQGVTYYGDRNSYRMRSYHRLDLTVSWTKQRRWGERKWSVGLYNAYNRLNPFYIDLQKDKNGSHFVEHSLFPIIPSITYSFKF